MRSLEKIGGKWRKFMSNLSDILKFVELTHKFQQVKREILIKDKDEKENDIEHSYQLAMLSWYLINLNNLDLDINKVIKYALVHDLVEVYAGDTPLWSTDQNLKNSKLQREKDAAERLEHEFSNFKDLHYFIDKYEKRDDIEAKFVYALDKILPIINIYLDNGRIWKQRGVTFEMLIQNKVDKVSVSPEVKKYFDDLLTVLQEKQQELFQNN